MLVVISPAKKLDWTADVPAGTTQPDFQQDALHLAKVARELSVGDLRKLMGISENLATLNRDRFAAFSAMSEDTRPAAMAFAGDTYVGLEARSLDADEMRYAQDHLRILSGLYGLLRPLDMIQPYRLEMGSRLKTDRGKSLYDYWGDRIAKAINAVETEWLLNCASNEYFKAVDQDALNAKVVTPVFLEDRDGAAKTVSFFAKRARGAMARFVIQNQIDRIDDLRGFMTGGYRFDPDRSEGTTLTFVRDYPESKLAS